MRMTRTMLRERVLNGMDLVGRRQEMMALWRGGFDLLVDYLALTAAPADVGLGFLKEELMRRPVRRTMVLTGVRCSGANPDGSDSPLLLGLAKVAELLAPVSCLKSEARTGHEPDALTLGISGEMTLTEGMGEIDGGTMAAQFNALTGNRYLAAVQHDSFALNTGDQGRLLAGLAFARRIDLVVISHVCDHGPRFGATIAAGLAQLIDVENGCLQAIAQQRCPEIDIRKHVRTMPDFLFVSHGDWSDQDPRRGKGTGILRAREAFGPVQTSEEAVYPGKNLGEEFGKRYFAEQSPLKSVGYACPALSPKEMFDQCIPLWVQERYFTS